MSRPTQRFRTAAGGRIARARTISFQFDGRRYTGHPGDTLASALLANGVHFVGRSFKYHRPRGIMTAGSEEPNALVTILQGRDRQTPNVRATDIELCEGLAAISQNRWPSLAFDAGALSGVLAPLFPAGFYYKTFMGPRFIGSNWLWPKLFEPLIRRAAGLGRAPASRDPDHYVNRYAHCDVLVVGAGPAGLAAALVAAEAGATVIVSDERTEFGGNLLSAFDAGHDGDLSAGVNAHRWREQSLAALAANARVTLLPHTTVFGAYLQNFYGLAERLASHHGSPPPGLPRERLWQVRAQEVVLATGAIERPLVFSGNDRPGVMLAGAVRSYLNRYGVMAGSRAVVVTDCDTSYAAACDLKRSGVDVPLIADLRSDVGGAAIDAAKQAGITVEAGVNVLGTTGRHRITSVLMELGPAGARERRAVPCDLVLMSGGWTPSVHLYSQARGKPSWSEGAQAFLPSDPVPHVHSAGGCAGTTDLEQALRSGAEAGAAAARALGLTVSAEIMTVADPDPVLGSRAGAPVMAPPSADAFIDFQNDVTTRDIQLATQEGFRSIEHIKRYTTTGMATDQGKTSNHNTIALAAGMLGRDVAVVGHTSYRAPFTPVTFGTLATTARGSLFEPLRRTPIDAWARAERATFEDVGQWQRARTFPLRSENQQQSIQRECLTVRCAAGVFDASTLGKIEVVGPDAATFLDRMYLSPLAKLAVGRCRYALQLNEAGFVIDDGIVARLAPDRFHVTTTTGGAQRVLTLMEDYLQTEFTDLTCWLTSITEHWGVIAVQGPRARDILEPLIAGLDISAATFPHMSVGTGEIAGVPMRLFRVSFTGELGFEINVPSNYARDIWELVEQSAERHGGTVYGTDAMHLLRAEKGYILVGHDTDGTVTPEDLGFGTGAKKVDFVGKRALARPDMLKSDRLHLVGLLAEDPQHVLEEGAQLTQAASPANGARADGHVTSAYMSPALGRSIALGLVAGGRARHGERLFVPMPSGPIAVRISTPLFLDAKGARLHG